jgi:hypothetical protein
VGLSDREQIRGRRADDATLGAGKMELERTDYSVPVLLEYRTPSLLFWTKYHQGLASISRRAFWI